MAPAATVNTRYAFSTIGAGGRTDVAMTDVAMAVECPIAVKAR
jgi:hypothetical protein